MLDYAHALSDLRSPPGNRLEALKGDLDGLHSVRINDQWRVVFRWTQAGPVDVDIRDYHCWLEGTMTLVRRRREPTSPGEILREEFLVPLGMTQKRLADHLGCDVKVVNRIINGRTSVTAEMALKLGATFRTTAEFWLNAQKAVDLYRAAMVASELPRPVLRAS